MIQINIKKTLLIVIPILLLVLGLFIYKQSLFRITASYPKSGGVFADSSLNMYVKFNREILVKKETTIKLTSKATGLDIKTMNTVSKDTLYIEIGKPLVINAKYELLINELYSTKSEKLSNKIEFTVDYVDFDKLPPEEQKKQIDRSVYYGADKLEGILPKETNNYSITTVPTTRGGDVATIKIDVKHNLREVVNGNLIVNNINDYYAKLKKYRTEALAYLKSKDVNINDYIIQYEEAELRDQFPQGGGIELE